MPLCTLIRQKLGQNTCTFARVQIKPEIKLKKNLRFPITFPYTTITLLFCPPKHMTHNPSLSFTRDPHSPSQLTHLKKIPVTFTFAKRLYLAVMERRSWRRKLSYSGLWKTWRMSERGNNKFVYRCRNFWQYGLNAAELQRKNMFYI